MTTAAVLTPPKKISVHGAPIRWRLAQQIAWSFLAANLGAAIIAAIYYLVTQVHYQFGPVDFWLKPTWDHLLNFPGWDVARHDVRGLYETALATLFVKSLMANWHKMPDKRVPAWRIATAPLLLIAVTAPIVVAGIYLLNYALPSLWHTWFGHTVIHNPVHFPHPLAFLGTFLATWPWQLVIIGIITGQVVHRIYAPVGNTVQLFGIGRQVDKYRDALAAGATQEEADKHRPKWPAPPVVRERFAWIVDNNLPVRDRKKRESIVVFSITSVLFALAIFGLVVKFYIAKGG